MKRWTIREKIPESADEGLSKYPEMLRDFLFWRGIEKESDAEEFLNPDYERDFHDPFLMLGMERATERIIDAIKKDEKIIVYADYDADGGPAAVVLHDFFKKIGFENFEVYIPHRYKEGYGLNEKAISKFAESGASLIITLDCGITDMKEVELANSLGMDVIVTDHHIPGEKVPEAYVIVNPKQKGDKYPFPDLSGGGIAFKLVQAIVKKGEFDLGQEGWEKWLLDMAGISTVADMVPLQGENRAIAHFGLRVLKKTPRPGILRLLQTKRISSYNLTEEDIGFVIAPHINAASRMASPRDAFDLLATRDDKEAHEAVSFLSDKNEERKKVVEGILAHIEELLEGKDLEELILLGSVKWKPGVLGLAANRAVEKYGKPVCLWGKEGGEVVRGSCRSDGSVNIAKLMQKIPEGYFLDSGGHTHSGGFSVNEEDVVELGNKLLDAHRSIEWTEPDGDLIIDRELPLSYLTFDTYNLLQSLAPFGVGNPKPVFLFKNLCVDGCFYFGKSKNHLRVNFKKDNGQTISAIKFFVSDEDTRDTLLERGQLIDIAGNLEKDTFNGAQKMRLRIQGLRNSKI